MKKLIRYFNKRYLWYVRWTMFNGKRSESKLRYFLDLINYPKLGMKGVKVKRVGIFKYSLTYLLTKPIRTSIV